VFGNGYPPKKFSSETERLVFLDNNNPIGGTWLTTMPWTKRHTLSDKEMSVALHVRTLSPGITAPTCSECGEDFSLNHDQVCARIMNWRTLRHNIVRDHIAHHVNRIPRTRVTTEPIIANNPRDRRTDIRIEGPGAPNGVDSETDVKITCVTSRTNYVHLSSYQRLHPMVAGDSLISRAQDSIQAVLQKHAEIKEQHYEALPRDFVPLIFSSGGSMHPQVVNWFRKLNKAFPKNFRQRLLFQDIGITFLRCRTATFRFDPY
jgi:hypothetical protein